jgi:hypothetical protein
MTDIVVTVPKSFSYAGKRGLAAWVAEGDLPGDPWSGNDSHFYLGGSPPADLRVGDRVYVVCEGKLRGHAPLVRIDHFGNGYGLVRRGGAVAVTIDEYIRGFQGFRYRWWERHLERPFLDWMKP